MLRYADESLRDVTNAELVDAPVVLFLAACELGGREAAQRPPQLAREFAAAGMQVFYHSQLEPRSYRSDEGIIVIDSRGWQQLAPRFAQISAVCVCHYSPYIQHAATLSAAGWFVVYDIMDDWEAFVESCDMPDCTTMEPLLCRTADLVTVSAAPLVEYAEKRGAQRIRVIRNGGPLEPVDAAARKRRAFTRWSFSGSLWGTWFDWDIVDELSGCGDLSGLVMGKLPGSQEDKATAEVLRRYATPGVDYLGQVPHSEALERMAQCDCGIIPFKGRIARSVDPVKLYDHYAAGMWTVATHDLVPIKGEPYVLMADQSEFPDAVREAGRLTREDPPQPELVAQHAWRERARQMLSEIEEASGVALVTEAKALDALAEDALEQHARGNTVSLREAEAADTGSAPMRLLDEKRVVTWDDHKLRVSWQAPMCCDMDPICPYCFVGGCRNNQPPLSASHDAWLEAMREFGEKHGPLWINVALGEPMACDDVVSISAALSFRHHVGLNTNLKAPLQRFEWLAANGFTENLELSTSFHPHAVTIEEFCAKAIAVEQVGLKIACVGIVAYPPYLPNLGTWLKKLTRHGWLSHALPFQGRYDGHTYPAAYEDDALHDAETRELIQTHLEQSFGENQTMRECHGMMCRAGCDYVLIEYDGNVARCGGCRESYGNVLSGRVAIPKSASPCKARTCRCPDMWQYIIEPEDDAA